MNKLIDLTNKRFGLLVVQERNIENLRGRVSWKCLCDCGVICIVVGSDLKIGDVKSCGKHKHIDETGNRYGKLVVMKMGNDYIYTKKNGKIQSQIRWICQCDCGKVKSIFASSLRSGGTKSCGRCMPKGESAFNAFYHKMSKDSEIRNYVWELSKDNVRSITSKPCFYCGKIPSQAYRVHNDKVGYIHNGIDRMDSSIGYTIENCVPCCKACNYAKREMSISDFREWIVSVYNHFVT